MTTHISGQPVTVENLKEESPALMRNAIDQHIVKIRPMSTPVDQLSRCGSCRHADAMTIDYFSVDTKVTETELKSRSSSGYGNKYSPELYTFDLHPADDTIFEVSETILVPDVLDGNPLVLYCVAKDGKGTVTVAPVNIPFTGNDGPEMPELPTGTKLIRMGRAASELDVQTAQFSAIPQKATNNCQIFKMQVEQSTFAKIADKEVGWNFSDQEEAAIIDMRLGMEKSFLFGARAKIFDTRKREYLYLTGGIWNQTDREFTLDTAALTEDTLIDLCSAAFTGNNGSKRKILIAGTGLLEAISKLSVTRILRGTETRTKWGLEFKELVSNFGTLYLLHSEIFDQCGHRNDGFIIDPNYMTKYVHVPFRAEQLDLRSSGQRNTDAVVLTEASCLVLRYPKAHLKVKNAA